MVEMSAYQLRKLERIAAFNKTKGKKLVTCIACNGSGRYDSNGTHRCASCGGTGKERERC